MKCRHTETRVADSRWREGRTWRKRVCLKCRTSFQTYEVTAEEYQRFMNITSELDEPRWAVIAVNSIKGTDLTYAEALALMKEKEDECISTSEAAARMKSK